MRLRHVHILIAAALLAGALSSAPSETDRIRRHLLGAERLLIERAVSDLDPSRRAARARCLTDLRAYRLAGRFPHNHVRRERTPVFVDEHGTRCAMAWLIERSGGGLLVARIAGDRNLARIHGLAGEAELVAWLDRSGLTLDEAARIQPAYDGWGLLTTDRATPANIAAGVGALVGATGVGLNVTAATTRGSRNARGLAGVTCGVLGAALGVPALTTEPAHRGLGIADLAIGALSFGLGIHQLNSRPAKAVASSASWTPVMGVMADGSRRIGLQVAF